MTAAALSAAVSPYAVQAQSFVPEKLTTEYRSAPMGVAAAQPRLSWQIRSAGRDFLQSAYEVRTGANAATLAKGKDIAWQSGKVSSGESLHIPYSGSPSHPASVYTGRCGYMTPKERLLPGAT